MSDTTVNSAAPPPAADGSNNSPNGSAWNDQVKKAMVEGGMTILGSMVMNMMGQTQSDAQGDG